MGLSIRDAWSARAGGILAMALLLLVSGRAQAQVTVSGGLESFHWTEDTQPRRVEEHGPLASLAVGWTQRGNVLSLAYRSRYYLGWVNYRGSYLFAGGGEASGMSRYAGTSQEGQLRGRIAPAVDAYGALGAEVWRRSLTRVEREDFTVGYTRLGIGTHPAWGGDWRIDAGAKFILGVSEDAHLTDLGFDQNPGLEPRGLVGAFARLGYRVRGGWIVEAYLDGYRFEPSPQRRVTRARVRGTVFQPGSDMRVLGVNLTHDF